MINKAHSKKIIINPYNSDYKVLKDTMDNMEYVLEEALIAHPRLTAIRFDLHIPPSCLDPEWTGFIGIGVMKRFFSSLQAKIIAHHKFKPSRHDNFLDTYG